MDINVSGYNNADIKSLEHNNEFTKAIKPSHGRATSSKSNPKVDPNQLFIEIGRLDGIIYEKDGEMFVSKTPSCWLSYSEDGKLCILKGKNKKKRIVAPDYSEEYTKFHWGKNPEPEVAREFDYKPSNSAILGTFRGIMYQTNKKGDGDSIYVHAFESPFPLITESLVIIGGRYTIEKRGIVG